MSDKFKSVALGSIGYIIFFSVIGGLVLLTKDSDTTQPKTTQTEVLTAEESDYVQENGTSACTSDCSGHDAGYEWAEKYTICDTEYDNGNSESFNEGVRQWAEDNCYYSDGNNPI